MLSNKRLTTVISTLLISVMFLISLVSIKPIQAESTVHESIFYFVDMFDTNLPSYSNDVTLYPIPLVSASEPTKNNDSYYPPRIKDTDQLVAWFTFWMLEETFNMFDDFENLSDEDTDLINMLKLLLPNPLALVEMYQYTGNQTINISGEFSFNIYTDPTLITKIHKNDQLKVTLYEYSELALLPIPTEIANNTMDISPKFLQGTTLQTITVNVSDYKLRRNTDLIFSIELIPGIKPVLQYVLGNETWEKYSEWGLKFLKFIGNVSKNSDLNDIISFLEEFQNFSTELNFTSEQIADVINSMISTSIVYASQAHPTSVSVPFVAADSDNEELITYYLHSSSSMTTNSPTSSEYSTLSIIDENGIWEGPSLIRSKIISNVSAFVYIEYKDYRILKEPLTVEAKLISNGKELGVSSQTLSTSTKFSTSLFAYRFTFEDLSDTTEVLYGTKLELQIGILGTINKTSLLPYDATIYYDSEQYKSSLSFRLSETDHISVSGISDPIDGLILPGGNVSYILEITGEFSDEITLSIRSDSFSTEQQKKWKIEFSPSSFSIEEGGQQKVAVTITSLDKTFAAYAAGPLEVMMDIYGSTGFTSISLFADVNEDAVTYDFIILVPDSKDIIHGRNATYQFEVTNNNTGGYPDGYIFTVIPGESNFTYFPLTIDGIAYLETVTVNVTVYVDEKTEEKTDTFSFKVISKGSGLEKIVKVNSTIVGASIFENIYDYFATISDQLGLTEIFGSYGSYFLIVLLFIILFFIIILLVIILKTKFVDIICTDRIKEIYPNEKAIYELTVRNKTRKTRSYSVDVELSENGSKWRTSLDKTTLLVPAKQSQIIIVTVTSNDTIEVDDWTKATVNVTAKGRKRSSSIDLLTTVKDGTVNLSIDGVFHWPRRFESHQTVHTSFKLHNNGYIQAKKVNIRLYINGEEKNKVEDVDIPAGGYADIILPWKANEGKNELQIIVS